MKLTLGFVVVIDDDIESGQVVVREHVFGQPASELAACFAKVRNIK